MDCPDFLDCAFPRTEAGTTWSDDDQNLVWETYCAGPCWPLCHRRLQGARLGMKNVSPRLCPTGDYLPEEREKVQACKGGETGEHPTAANSA